MRNYTILIILLCIGFSDRMSAQNQKADLMLRIYEDNDFINDIGKGTDDAYTNGTRIDLFYNKQHDSKFIVDRVMPKAGDNSINTFGLGLVQLMYTPKDITNAYYQPNDYAWSGAMYLTHTLYSYNPIKKYDYQTEIVAGVIGPAALAEPSQVIVHHIISDPSIPNGWSNQFKNNLLVNLNFTAEKELWHLQNNIELIAFGKILMGTMIDAVDFGPVLQAGLMNPYFNGFMGHHSTTNQGKRAQIYFKIKPGMEAVAWNSMVEGSMFSRGYSARNISINSEQGNPAFRLIDQYTREPHPAIENLVTYLSYSLEVVYGHLSISFTQTHNSQLVKNTYSHTYGNLTITYIF